MDIRYHAVNSLLGIISGLNLQIFGNCHRKNEVLSENFRNFGDTFWLVIPHLLRYPDNILSLLISSLLVLLTSHGLLAKPKPSRFSPAEVSNSSSSHPHQKAILLPPLPRPTSGEAIDITQIIDALLAERQNPVPIA